MKIKLLIVLMSHLSDIKTKQYIPDSSARSEINEECEFCKFLLLKFPNTNIEINPEEQWELFTESKTPKKCPTCNGTGAFPGTSEDCPDCMASGLYIPDKFIL